MRHSGPSHDLLHSLRTMLEVKRRGRWVSDSSLAHYECHVLVAQQWQLLPALTQRQATEAVCELPRVLLAALRPGPPTGRSTEHA
eukprot:1458436-Amphidinium_carterae.1